MNTCGIYKITNQINNKVYIGQSIHIELRWKQHHTEPFNTSSDAYNTIFYKAIRKYGINNFLFEIIEECPKQELNDKEQYWIWFYDAYNKNKGYNMTSGGQFNDNSKKYDLDLVKSLWNDGKTPSEIIKILNCTDTTLTNYFNYLNIPVEERLYRANAYKAKTVYQYSNNKLINTFPSVAAAVRYLQTEYPTANTGNLSCACTGKISSAYGYIWSYEPLSVISSNIRHKKVNQYDLNGKFIQTFNSQKEAANAVNSKTISSITNACTGISKTSKGYIWRYYDASLENPTANLTNI